MYSLQAGVEGCRNVREFELAFQTFKWSRWSCYIEKRACLPLRLLPATIIIYYFLLNSISTYLFLVFREKIVSAHNSAFPFAI